MTTETIRANLDDFTIRIANHDQQVQHAKAGYVHWKKNNSFEVSSQLFLVKMIYRIFKAHPNLVLEILGDV